MNKFVHIILAILLPPVAVFLKSGFGKDLLINIVLCLFFMCRGSYTSFIKFVILLCVGKINQGKALD